MGQFHLKKKRGIEYKQRSGDKWKKIIKEKTSNKHNIEIEFKPKKGQQEIIDRCLYDLECKKLVVTMGRQYGKSMCMRYVMMRWLAENNVTIGYMCPTNRLAREIYQKMMQMFESCPHLIKSKNATDLQITLINNARLLFFSLESINTVRGFTLYYCIIDETAHCRMILPDGQHAYHHIISPLLDAHGRKTVFISTPNGSQGFFYEEYLKAKNKEPKYHLVQVPITDDETKDTEWFEEKRKSLPENVWRQEYLCEFLDNGISYFNGFMKLFTESIFDFNQKLYIGVDFSTTGNDETILTFVNESGQVKQYLVEGDLDNKYNVISKLLNEHSDNIVWGYMERNSIGTPMFDAIKKLLVPRLRDKITDFYTSNDSKRDIINLLAMNIEKGNLKFMEDNDDLREQFKTFSYKISNSGNMIFGATSGNHDDRVMSLAFAVNAWNEKRSKGNTDYIKVIKR